MCSLKAVLFLLLLLIITRAPQATIKKDEIRTPNDEGMTKPQKPRSPNGQWSSAHKQRTFLVQLVALWRDAIGECVGVEISVLAQLVPRTVFLGRLRNTVLFARGEVLPRIVASDG